MKTKLGFIFGGISVEHEISVISALQAIHAADSDKYDIVPIYITKQGQWYSGDALLNVDNYKDINKLQKSCKKVFLSPISGDHRLYFCDPPFWKEKFLCTLDLIIPVLHGTLGEDGSIQGLFELNGIPYCGCNPLASANGMDKITMKMILKDSGLPVVDYTWFYFKNWFKDQGAIKKEIEKLGFPLIVKPSNLGSSVGISKADNWDELQSAIEFAASFTSRIIVEKMVTNLKEINCAVLGEPESAIASVCEEPVKTGDFLSYQDKYMSKGSKGTKSGSGGMSNLKRIIPANIPEELSNKISELALETFRVLACSGTSRIDFMIDTKSNQVFVNEINTIPGSLSFYLWEASGVTFKELIDRLVAIALKIDREKKSFTISYDKNIFEMGMSMPKMGKA